MEQAQDLLSNSRENEVLAVFKAHSAKLRTLLILI